MDDESEINFLDVEPKWPGPSHDLLSVGENPETIFFLDWQQGDPFSLQGCLLGYRKAAQLLAEQVLQRGQPDELDTVFFPFASIWRHYMELRLKSLVLAYRVLLDKERGKLDKHYLWPLWTELRALMQEAGEDVKDQAVKSAGRLLQQFDALDPSSEEFRYDRRKNGTPTLPDVTTLDWVSFHDGLDAVAQYLEAVDMSVDNRLDFKRELRAEYEADMRELYEHDGY